MAAFYCSELQCQSSTLVKIEYFCVGSFQLRTAGATLDFRAIGNDLVLFVSVVVRLMRNDSFLYPLGNDSHGMEGFSVSFLAEWEIAGHETFSKTLRNL